MLSADHRCTEGHDSRQDFQYIPETIYPTTYTKYNISVATLLQYLHAAGRVTGSFTVNNIYMLWDYYRDPAMKRNVQLVRWNEVSSIHPYRKEYKQTIRKDEVRYTLDKKYCNATWGWWQT